MATVFPDQLGNLITINEQPRRIISLVPSHTEMLFDLNLDNRIAGVTKFCTRPGDKVKNIAKVGGTKQLDIQAIINLEPDLIIANKEENTRSEIEYLQSEFPVWISDIYTLRDATAMIQSVGAMTGQVSEAQELVASIDKAFLQFKQKVQLKKKPRIAYFIWRKPYMLAAADTFIDHILNVGGFDNASSLSRYPVVSAEDIAALNPDAIFLSSEPYPFRVKHIAEFQALCPQAQIVLVDGEMFSWYGSRLRYTPEYLGKIILENFKKLLQD